MKRRMNQHKKPCEECPFARKTEPGMTGGTGPSVYVGQAMGPFLLSCHMSPGYAEDRRSSRNLQCAGAATYRANIGVASLMPDFLLKLPADRERVFAEPAELLAHHLGVPIELTRLYLEQHPPSELLGMELAKQGCQLAELPSNEQ